MEKNNISSNTAKGLAVISFLVSFMMITILVSDFIKTRNYDPLANPVMTMLLKELEKNPDNEELKIQIRELDYISRNLFFTTKAQIKKGGSLLFAFLVIFLVSTKAAIFLSNKQAPPKDKAASDEQAADKNRTEKLLLFSSLILLVTALFFYSAQNGAISTSLDQQPLAQADPAAAKEVKEGQYLSHDEITASWLNLRGPYGNGVAYNATPPIEWNGETGQGIIWKSEIDLLGQSSPVVHKDQIFITGASKTEQAVYSFDYSTGRLLWRVNVHDHITTPGEKIKEKKLIDTGYAASTMASDGERVFAIFTTGEIICLSYTGEHVWSRAVNLSDNTYGHSSSLMVYEDMLYVQLDKKSDSKLLILKCENGEEVNSVARKDMISWSSPVLYIQPEKEPQIIINANPYTISYSPAGTENWRRECVFGDVASSVCYFENRIYATNIRACLFSLDAMDGKIIWESCDPLCPDASSPVATKDFVFMATAPGVVSCISTADGSLLWEEEMEEMFYSSPILADNKIFVTDRKGTTRIFEAKGEYNSISEPQLFEDIVATPAFIKDKIVMRGRKHLFLIGKK